jgi:hypothetical protein
MNPQDYDLYLEEIIKRSELALDAIGQLNFSVANLNRLSKQSHQHHKYNVTVFYSIHIFLTQAGMISRMLWAKIPPTGKNSRGIGNKRLGKESENQITKNMKKRLKLSGRAILKNWKLSDRFNEQTEQSWIQSLEQDGECYVLGSPFSLPSGYPSLNREFCYYDPISRNFHFKGEIHNIQDAAAEIFKLLSLARDAQRKHRMPMKSTDPIYIGQVLQMTI